MKNRFLLLTLSFTAITFYSFSQKQKFDLRASIDRGKEVYVAQCMSCHMENGEGIPDVYPPLAKSDYLMADRKRAIDNIIHGLSGEIVVNGKTYNMEMVAIDLSDQDVSDVVNYIRNSWGNRDKKPVRPEDVEAARSR